MLGGHGGDDDRPAAPARDARRGPPALPDPRRQRGPDRARLQRPLRHGPVDARRHPARDEPAARRPHVRRARLRQHRARRRAARARAPARRSSSARSTRCAALEARMEGFEVLPALRAAERGDVFVTVTGGRDVLRREHFERMKDGAVLANAGHFDVEIDLDGAARAGGGRRAPGAPARRPVRPRRPAAEPARRRPRREPRRRARATPRRSWTCPSRSRRWRPRSSCATAATLGPGVHPVPARLDREVARLKLASLGVEIDELTAEQERYLGVLGVACRA